MTNSTTNSARAIPAHAATTAPKGRARGHNVKCPACGERGLRVDAADMDTISCSECNEEWQLPELHALALEKAEEARRLDDFCEWVAAAPTYSTDEE